MLSSVSHIGPPLNPLGPPLNQNAKPYIPPNGNLISYGYKRHWTKANALDILGKRDIGVLPSSDKCQALNPNAKIFHPKALTTLNPNASFFSSKSMPARKF